MRSQRPAIKTPAANPAIPASIPYADAVTIHHDHQHVIIRIERQIDERIGEKRQGEYAIFSPHGHYANSQSITPTAVIKQMNLLESRLGLTLFHQSHQGLSLTRADALMPMGRRPSILTLIAEFALGQ